MPEPDKADPLDTVFAYHERTKHHFHRFAEGPDGLDWASQPHPFRRFLGAPETQLLLPDSDTTPDYDAFFNGQSVKSQPLSLQSLSQFFYYSLALSAWKSCFGNRWSLRVNPSSGNLHPTECYLLTDTVPEISPLPGVYHYYPLRHQLECRLELQESDWKQLTNGLTNGSYTTEALPEGSFLIALCSIHWRESWKYGERAFRYCQHDCGHALAATTIAAGLMGWQLTLIEGISDAELVHVLGVDRDDDYPNQQEREAPDLLAVVSPAGTSINLDWRPPPETLNALTARKWLGKANLLSSSHKLWPWIDKATAACEKPTTESHISEHLQSFNPRKIETTSDSESPLSYSGSSITRRTGSIIRQRRSALDMDGKTRIEKAIFYQILDRTLPGQNTRLFSATTWVHLGLFVHRIDGLQPGLYLLLRDPAKTEQLRALMSETFIWQRPPDCPESLSLYCLLPADAQEAAKLLSCHQEIASGGVFSCAMLAEFEQPLRQLGTWWYRRLYWETGIIGQMLYLEAEAKGIRATGIGCYFDDPVHEVFGLKDRSYQSLYHFTMGGPVEDTRLETLPAYHFMAGKDNHTLN
ncbi:hypothetical protein BIT28_06025 [Photobacterium proteolyticum]|uniref:Uncharacterized protein n=1 Tax=Photobacterium proteolyticum TaxID=1903952 RepID=A0A1Q9GF32_9GAMM|nr:hypothetical protein BIT28_06025 [Photobacterium proteolyticum]